MKFQNVTLQTKINLLLATLVLVMLGLSATRLWFIETSRETFDRVAETSRFASVSAKALNVASNQLETLVPELTQASRSEDISEIRRRLNQIIDNAILAAGPMSQTDDIGASLRLQLEILSNRMQSALASRRDLLRAEVDLATAQRKIVDASARVQLHSRQLYTEWLGQSATADGLSTGKSLAFVLRETELIMRLNVQFTNLLTLSKTIAASEFREDSLAAMSQSTAIISSAVRDLAKLPDSEARNSLVSGLRDLLAALGGKDGFQESALEFERASKDYDAASNEVLRALAAATAAIGDTIATLDRMTTRQSELFSRTASLAVKGEIMLNLIFGGAIVLAVWWVVRHQVIQRMETLCHDVVTLADGDLDAVPQVSGTDEIGRVGEALQVFRQNARELRRSNDDLANFAYVASHDLRSPLRAIRDLVVWTIEDHGKALGPEVRENLDMIQGRADRLSRLLNDLLDYARIDNSQATVALVDMRSMVSDIAEIVDPADKYHIRFSGDRLFEIAETPVRTILLNLVSNAIKHHDCDHGNVRIEARAERGSLSILVRDDGPGIAPKYQTKVWELFQTLRDANQTEASGLGLAMVRKLVDALDGTIQLRSNPDVEKGTVFIINIPLRVTNEAAKVVNSMTEVGAA